MPKMSRGSVKVVTPAKSRKAKAPVAVVEVKSVGRPTKNSIRQLIRQHLLAGTPTPQIAEDVRSKFPNSAAAAKSSKHISYYASVMRKAGELPARQPTAVGA